MGETKYEILEDIILNFTTHNDQQGVILGSEDEGYILVDNNEVYFVQKDKKYLTIDYPKLITNYESDGKVRRIDLKNHD
jgi:maltodextrin utilization protein YvdJ